jgi:hypothetical protein
MPRMSLPSVQETGRNPETVAPKDLKDRVADRVRNRVGARFSASRPLQRTALAVPQVP